MAKKDKADKKGGKKDKAEKKKDAGREVVNGAFAPIVTQTARSLRTLLSRNLADCGLYAGQDGVVQALAGEDGLTPGALAQKLGVKAPTMTRTIGRMEAQGFVERRADTLDHRLTKVFLTDGGRASLERIAAAAEACEREALHGLSGKEVKTLLRLLFTVEENLQSAIGKR
ncbi:MarR family winged helix-turn-helix transcriptional regulator [Ciceribacter sp. RN22]|uniref:MarR family winged helix-turn-helix transcriptional regulator n=1 Tax=Ciceribacter sp. RN22 TaxID=2954932 RepID=UPI002092C7FF|nr:MarR family winged helix-turn-helix transcriptional regulator [Ciceribacter sp. RN22]MCO6180016.1 MarR family winged helix-turn-helix transcriptional regulator [Ciceribacter sp. RN22]